jgi:hypothetical protein
MNYIRHLTSFFERVDADKRINPFHISLYMALFQLWNAQRFENPISVSRAELMSLSRIGSTHTYYKCLSELNSWNYIIYTPSKNNLVASTISLCIFDTSSAQACSKSDTSSAQAVHQVCSKNDTSGAQAVHPYYKHNINIINNKTYIEEQSQKNENQNLISKNSNSLNPKIQKEKRKKVAPKKEKAKKNSENKFVKPQLEEIMNYFISENYPEIEAQKFFNHFESNGWKVGGKTPMKNWQAAARNWMLNIQNFITPKNFPNFPKYPKPKQHPKPDPNNKNYDEPL